SIEFSEIVDYGTPERRYNSVRVFRTDSPKQSRGGREPTYDWEKLAEKLEQEGWIFDSKVELIEYCRANVRPIPGKRGNKDGPNDNTIRPAISKYNLEKFIKPGEA